ncbi:DUF3793 family protein [Collinsella sp. AGMB00827]|uniref:DUF3793 family protein n=1 Tax=Collinsella ureilytica TaxID=2869515 RepID=A0ABS7MHR2_9ACTN|nr:DUF3793 family protein [Collinsella urealyticum]
MTRLINAATLEASLIRNAAPTITGIMPANLFTFPGRFVAYEQDGGQQNDEITQARSELMRACTICSRTLAQAGIRLRVLVWRRCGALIMLYRPSTLEAHLAHPHAQKALTAFGYPKTSHEAKIDILAERLAICGQASEPVLAPRHPSGHVAVPSTCSDLDCARPTFPHEVGYFLGYPFADVDGFIRHKGQNFILLGPWKVYEDREGAERAFEQIRTSREQLKTRYRRGVGLEKLAVACA